MFDDLQYKLLVKPLIDAYPNARHSGDDVYYSFCGYDPLLMSMGFDIVLKVDDDDYSGDSRLIFKHGDFYGLLIFGWGSCSGCDSLQGCSSYEEVEQLRKELFNSIKWSSASELLEYFEKHDWEGDYSYRQNETKLFIEQGIKLLKAAV